MSRTSVSAAGMYAVDLGIYPDSWTYQHQRANGFFFEPTRN
ncbi:hypothetical protein [Sodalis sp.]